MPGGVPDDDGGNAEDESLDDSARAEVEVDPGDDRCRGGKARQVRERECRKRPVTADTRPAHPPEREGHADEHAHVERVPDRRDE